VPPQPRLILASASPQRSEILARVGIPFEARPMDVDELAHGEPAEVAAENARRKALAAAATNPRTAATDPRTAATDPRAAATDPRIAGAREFGPQAAAPSDPRAAELQGTEPGGEPPGEPPGSLPILGADTLVTIDGDVLGKPADETQALAYLARLAGREHQVVGAIALVEGGKVAAEAVEVTTVRFRALDPATLTWYAATGEWRGRAGGYAIQGIGAVLVARIEGDYLNVVGLPLARLLELRPRLLHRV
jgi:septum formation protein